LNHASLDVIRAGFGILVGFKDILAVVPLLVLDLVFLAAVDLEMILCEVVAGVGALSGFHVTKLVHAPAR